MSGYGDEIKKHFTEPDGAMLNPDNLITEIVSALVILGYICAVVMIFYIAIQYFIATPAKKAQLKTQLIYLVAGAFLLTSGTTVLGVISGAFASWFS